MPAKSWGLMLLMISDKGLTISEAMVPRAISASILATPDLIDLKADT